MYIANRTIAEQMAYKIAQETTHNVVVQMTEQLKIEVARLEAEIQQLKSDKNTVLKTVDPVTITYLTEKYRKSAKMKPHHFNDMLALLGYQTYCSDHWEPTDKGKPYCIHSYGILKWFEENLIVRLREDIRLYGSVRLLTKLGILDY
jgi:hypothetical protein